jgi:small-conductance mechanosensitive channel
VGITILLQTWGLPTEWFISVSALTGAAVGFASTQTLGNFLAGLYIMITRPFEVNDYVKIGTAEGEVKEITLNYVKIYTPTYTIMQIPNRTLLNSSITRYMDDEDIAYSFPMSFASKVYSTSWVHLSDLLEKIVEPAIDEFWDKHGDVLTRKPEVSVSRVEFLNRTMMIRMFVPEGKTQLLYDLQPELQKMILKRLDDYREAKGVNFENPCSMK